METAFLGNAAWSVHALEALARSRHRIPLVVTRVPRPAGRGSVLRPTPVADAARRLGLPLAEVETVKSGRGFDALAASRPEALVVVAYGEILPPAVLSLPSVAPVNLHFSLLPELRGAAPVQRAILEGLPVTGVTTIRMDEGMDSGPILLHTEEAIAPEDDAGSLGERLAAIGGRLVIDTLDRLESGAIEEHPQDHALATYAPKLGPEDRTIDWSVQTEAILRRVRAMAPEPAAETLFRGKRLKIHRATARFPHTPLHVKEGLVPGEMLGVEDGSLAVRTGGGASLVPLEVQPEGKRRMTVEEFVRGYRPRPGERLG